MTWEELEKIESYLKENGYRKGDYPMHCNSDYYWYKAFGKEDNPYEANRSLWQVFINVYDWRKFQYRARNLKDASITATVHISRTIDERAIELNWDLTDGFDLKDIEDKAWEFFKYVDENFDVQLKEKE